MTMLTRMWRVSLHDHVEADSQPTAVHYVKALSLERAAALAAEIPGSWKVAEIERY